MRTESDFTAWAMEALIKVNAKVIVLAGQSSLQQPGLPDRYICHRRWRGWLEVKRGDNWLSEAQALMLQGLHERGDEVLVAVWDTREDRIVARDCYRREICSMAMAELRAESHPARGLSLLSLLEAARDGRVVEREWKRT